MANGIFKMIPDKVQHLIQMFFVTLFFALLCWKFPTVLSVKAWTYAVVWAVVIELTQAEYGVRTVKQFFRKLFSKDTALDLLFDGIGILSALHVLGRLF